jgi:tellurite resistance protein TerC
VILGFIGVKLILTFLHERVSTNIPMITIPISLAVILSVLTGTTVASLLRARHHPERRAHTGALRARSRRPGADSR